MNDLFTTSSFASEPLTLDGFTKAIEKMKAVQLPVLLSRITCTRSVWLALQERFVHRGAVHGHGSVFGVVGADALSTPVFVDNHINCDFVLHFTNGTVERYKNGEKL